MPCSSCWKAAKKKTKQKTKQTQTILKRCICKRFPSAQNGALAVPLLLTASLFSSLPQITFYEGKCFTGRKLEVCGSCGSFQDRGFLNRVNSICVQSGAWVCFDHPDFRGQQYILEHGEYPDFYRWNGRSDHLGSCRPVGMHGEHYRIEIFEGSHFSGPSLELTEDCSFLQGQGWDKTCINALKVYGDGA
ncbi:gamma-crystallin N isoform X1 [Haliaeetus albicilla]|uniref:gamma-crystallin N isoform X1 n=1 Tax=Haliaeetus albicilla TaxID=8969 RepID=UPI0037E74979